MFQSGAQTICWGLCEFLTSQEKKNFSVHKGKCPGGVCAQFKDFMSHV